MPAEIRVLIGGEYGFKRTKSSCVALENPPSSSLGKRRLQT